MARKAANIVLDKQSLIEFRDTLRRFEKVTKKDRADVLRTAGKRVVMEAVKWTPPYPNANPNASLSQHKKAGERAIDIEVQRTQIPLNEMKMFNQPTSKRLKKFMRNKARYRKAIESVLKQSGYPNANVIQQASKFIHQSERNNRGKVRGNFRQNFVTDGRTVRAYIKEQKQKVGTGKSGWSRAARALGLKGIPKWVTSKGGRGTFRSRLKAVHQFIEFSNEVPHIQIAGRESRTLQKAFKGVEFKMRKEIENKLRARANRAGRR